LGFFLRFWKKPLDTASPQGQIQKLFAARGSEAVAERTAVGKGLGERVSLSL
jgi:hypothetical protein